MAGFGGREGGVGGGGANEGALLRQNGETDLGLYLSDPKADKGWHLLGEERTLFDAATAASVEFANQDQDATLAANLPTDWVAKPETLNTRQVVYRQLARARGAISADYSIGNLLVTSALAGLLSNNDQVSITPGRAASGVLNARAEVDGRRGVVHTDGFQVRSPNFGGRAASRVVRITSGSTQQILITRTAVGETGNGFRLLFEYDASASAGNPEVSYVNSGSGIDGILVGLNGATTFTQIISAINAATDTSSNKYVIATGADASDGGSFSTSASFNYVNTTSFWPIQKQSNGAGGGLEGGIGVGDGATTNIGAVEVHMTGARSGVSGATASASRFLGNFAFRITFHEEGAAGNGWVITMTGNSGGGTTVDADAKTVAVNINGNLTYLAMKTAIDAIRVGGAQFFTASYSSGLDSQNAGNGSWTLSGGRDQTLANPLAAEYDGSTNTLTIRALPTDTVDAVMDEISTLDEFQRARNGSPADGSMPGDVWLTSTGTTADTIHTPSDTSSTLQYIFSGGVDAQARSEIAVADSQAVAGVAASGNWFNIPSAGLSFRYWREGTVGNGFTVESWVRYEEDLSGGRAHTDIVLGGQTIRFQWEDGSAAGNGFRVRVRRSTVNPGIGPHYTDHSAGGGGLRIDIDDGTYSVNELINIVNRGLQLDGATLRLGIVTAVLETDNGNAQFTVNSSFTDIDQTFSDAGSSIEMVAEYQDAATLRIYAVVNQRRRYGGNDDTYLRSDVVAAINAARFEGVQLIIASTNDPAGTSGFTIPSDAEDGYEARFARINQSTILAGGVDTANRITITGVLRTDPVADIISAYSGARFVLSAVDGDPSNAIGAFSAEAGQSLTGGSDAIGRLLPSVTLGDTGVITIAALLYDDEAENTTLLELQDAFLAATYLDDDGNRPPFPFSGLAFAQTGGAIGDPIRNQSRPTIPTGGENEVPETPIELVSRPNDEVRGPNLLLRYHSTDPLQRIIDALIAGGAGDKVVDVFGTDLTAIAEAPPFSRAMYREAEPPAAGSIGVNVQDEGSAVGATASALNFTGAGVEASGSGAVKTINIPGGGPSSGGDGTVSSDATLTGDGSSGDPLKVANPFTAGDESKLDGIAANANAYTLPQATEALRGGVQGATSAQATGASGTTILGWTVNRIRQLLGVALPTIDNADAIAGTSTARRVWTSERVRQAINAVVPAVFRDGDTSRINIAKLASGTPDGTKFVRDDGTLATPAGSGGAGEQGPPGPPGSLGLTKVGSTIALDSTPPNAASQGPALTDLTDQIKFRITYERGGQQVLMWSDYRKVDISTSEQLQFQGGGGAYMTVEESGGNLQLTYGDVAGFSSIEVEVFNVGAANGIPAWDAETDYADTDQSVYDEKLYIANKAIPGDANNDNPATATDDWDGVGTGGGDGAALSDADPLIDGEASAGTSSEASRADHVHPAGPVLPHVSSFSLSRGAQDPAAGSIAALVYSTAWAIAQSDHVGAARIIGFKGAFDDSSVTTLHTLASGNYAHGSSDVTIPTGISLAADETYTLRLQVFGESVTSPQDATVPASYQDIVITAHAAALADYHVGYVAYNANDADGAATLARIVDFSNDSATFTSLPSRIEIDVPADGSAYQLYLAAESSETQPGGFTSDGLPVTASFYPGRDKAVSGTTYTFYVLRPGQRVTSADNGDYFGVT